MEIEKARSFFLFSSTSLYYSSFDRSYRKESRFTVKEKKIPFSRILWPLTLFVTALIPRLLYLRDLYGTVYFDHLIIDSQVYHRSALMILDGLWTASGIYYLGPLYAFFLAGIYALFGVDFLAVRLLQCGLGAAGAVMVYALGRRFFSSAVGVAAALLYAFHGVILFYEGQFLAASPAVFLTLLLIFVLSKPGETGLFRWLGGGLVLGLCVLLRPNYLLFIPVILFWLLFFRCHVLKKKISAAAVLCLGTAVMVFPVTLRNYLVDGDLLLLTPNGGINFYIGNNPAAVGRFSPLSGVALDLDGQARDAAAVAEKTLGRALKPSEVSGFWMAKGRAFLLGHPVDAIKLIGAKCLLFWNGEETRLNLDFNFHRRFSRLLRWPLSGFGLLAPFAIAGMALSLNRWKTCFPLYAAVFVSFLTVLLFFMSDRYRLPSVPFLLIFAVFGVRQLISFAGDRKWRPLFFTILLLAGGFLLTCLPLSGEVPNVSAYFNLARIYERSGWAGRAVAAYEKAILINATAKADAIVTGACLSVTAAGDQRAPGGAAAIFEIREVLKGPVSAARIKLPCRLSGEASASPAGREPLPFFQTGEHFLLYLKEGMDPRFTVNGGPYG